MSPNYQINTPERCCDITEQLVILIDVASSLQEVIIIVVVMLGWFP